MAHSSMSEKEKKGKIKRQVGRTMILVFAGHGRLPGALSISHSTFAHICKSHQLKVSCSRWKLWKAKRPLFLVCEAASKLILSYESIVRFFSISFRIRNCQPFWVPMQAQLAQLRPHVVFDQSQNRSVCKFRLLLLSRFLSNLQNQNILVEIRKRYQSLQRHLGFENQRNTYASVPFQNYYSPAHVNNRQVPKMVKPGKHAAARLFTRSQYTRPQRCGLKFWKFDRVARKPAPGWSGRHFQKLPDQRMCETAVCLENSFYPQKTFSQGAQFLVILYVVFVASIPVQTICGVSENDSEIDIVRLYPSMHWQEYEPLWLIQRCSLVGTQTWVFVWHSSMSD